MKNKYRIIKDSYNGYEAQVKHWWFPFWVQIWRVGFVNSCSSVEEAEKLCRGHASKTWHDSKVVKIIGYL